MDRCLAALFLLALCTAACDGGGDTLPLDAGADAVPPAPDAAVPVTVFEHLVTSGTWASYFRAREVGCTGCREVDVFAHVADVECGCVHLTIHRFWDVVATDNPRGLMDGDERCTQVFRLQEVPVPGLDPRRRSLVTGTVLSTTCGGSAGATLSLLYDAQAVDAAGRPGVIAVFGPSPFDPRAHSTGYPTDLADLLSPASSVPLVRCAPAEFAPGRDYCMPGCDFPGADPGRMECGWPPYEDVAP